jgi:hypothetical protein
MTPAELAIRAAVQAVEEAGCDVLLTDAVILLGHAREKVADYVDRMNPERASNCTMPNDMLHRCWVRHGNPPMITVDKNGPTCGAGAGSILSGNWHGFLRNGELVTA